MWWAVCIHQRPRAPSTRKWELSSTSASAARGAALVPHRNAAPLGRKDFDLFAGAGEPKQAPAATATSTESPGARSMSRMSTG